MKLSTLYTTVPDYIEFAWVTAPNAAGQSISGNTVTTLTLDTEVADTGSLVSAPTSNQFTLPAGTYYFEAETKCRVAAVRNATVFSLYNFSDSAYISKSGRVSIGSRDSESISCALNGQFVISSSKTFELRLLCQVSATVDNGTYSIAFTDSTANADQRTTIKLWKLK